MLDKIKRLIEKIKYYFSHEACYNEMEQQGIAVFGICCGITGSDRNSEYLSYQCMDCPYLTLSERKKEKKMTTQEAIKGLKNLFSKHELDLPCQDSLEISHIAIKSMEKQIPKKPMVNKFNKDIEVICPNCNEKKIFR